MLYRLEEELVAKGNFIVGEDENDLQDAWRLPSSEIIQGKCVSLRRGRHR